MRKLLQKGAGRLKQFGLLVIAAAIAVLAMPIGLIASTAGHADAEVVTGEHVGGAPDVTVSASGEYTLTINYFREKGDYTDWNVWGWWNGTGGSGARYDFSKVNISGKEWLTTTINATGVTVKDNQVIGFICRRSNASSEWAEKFAGEDSDVWVPLSFFDQSGAATVYVADDNKEIYDNPGDAMDHKIILRMSEARFLNFTTVRVAFNKPVTDKSIFVLKDSSDNVIKRLVPLTGDEQADATKNFKKGSSYIDFDLGEDFEIDFGETYTVYDEPTGDFNAEVNYPAKAVIFYSLFDTENFNNLYKYEGTLGAEYAVGQTKFTVWSPISSEVNVVIYEAGEGGDPLGEYPMEKGSKGEWTATVTGDLNGKYYTYKIKNKVGTVNEVVDPYAKSAGRNGKRGMVLDLDSTDPEGWANHSRPAARGSYSNAIIYEAHIRDLTMHESSNVSDEHKGKFLGLTEKASEANGNKKTPLDYIKELGVTEVHILPMFDINSVDEYTGKATYDKVGEFNWGYDPLNYNVPEGSYSTDPTDGAVRVNELKQMVMALHEAGIRVIMDVVYNHVADVKGSNFQALMPGYYFRTTSEGTFKQASGCGNDTASERAMYRKFMVESVNYWADEYKLDGFRFDLMGLHDTITMNEIYNTLAQKNPDIMVYGEGWKMDSVVETATIKPAHMYNASLMPNIAFFDDGTRDTLKGGGYGQAITANGFISGSKVDAAVYMGAAGATNNADAGYSSAGKRWFATNPTQNINYVSCHDNSSLWDKINASTPGVDNDTKKAMNRLAAAAVLTSQGPSFFLAGEELLRTKPTTETNEYDNRPEKWADKVGENDYYFADNSYKSPDSVNAIDWTLATTNADMVEFYKQLIALKKNSPMFRLTTRAQVLGCLKIVDAKMKDGLVSYSVKDPDSNEYAVVLFNATDKEETIKIPDGTYSVYVNGAQANATTALSTFSGDSFVVGAYSAVVMKAELDEEKLTAWEKAVKPESTTPTTPTTPETPDENKGEEQESSNLGLALGLGIGIPAVVLVAGGVVFGLMYSKKKGKKGESKDSEQAPEPADEPDGPTDEPDGPTDEPAEAEEEKAEEPDRDGE